MGATYFTKTYTFPTGFDMEYQISFGASGKWMSISGLNPKTRRVVWNTITDIKDGIIQWVDYHHRPLSLNSFPQDIRDYCQKLWTNRIFW